jgi:AcrR family transcriptional regulator
MAGRQRVYAGQSAEARALARRDRLVEAAIKVYGAQGYRNATVKAVCEAAGLTERYFYESFANSETLLIAAFDTVAHQVLRCLDQLRAQHDGKPAERGRAVLRAYYQILKDDPDGARLFVLEIARVGPAVDDVLASWMVDFGALLSRTLAPQRSAGAARGALLRAGAAGAVVQIARGWIRGGYAQGVFTVAEDALRICRVLEADLDAG